MKAQAISQWKEKNKENKPVQNKTPEKQPRESSGDKRSSSKKRVSIIIEDPSLIQEHHRAEKVRPDSPCASGPRTSNSGPLIIEQPAPQVNSAEAEKETTPLSSKKETQSWEVVNICNACKCAMPDGFQQSEGSNEETVQFAVYQTEKDHPFSSRDPRNQFVQNNYKYESMNKVSPFYKTIYT